MKITLKNYELYFADYMDGKLTSEQLSELGLFLNLHPELRKELVQPEEFVLQQSSASYQNKSFIKKFEFDQPFNELNFADYCIAYYEKLLPESKRVELEQDAIKNELKKKEFTAYSKPYLKPQSAIHFPKKENLYRKSKYRKLYTVFIISTTSIAACIVLLFNIFLKNDIPSVRPSFTSIAMKKEPVNDIKINSQIDLNKSVFNNVITKNKKIAKQEQENKVAFQIDEHSSDQMLIPVEYKPIESKALSGIIGIEELQKQYVNQSSNITTVEPTNLIKAIESKITNIADRTTSHKKISLFRLAQLGIRGINKLTDSNMSLTENRDTLQNVTAYSFKSELLEFQRTKTN